MAPYESGETSADRPEGPESTTEPRASRRKASRYVVPVAVLGVAAATIGLVPALADSGDPDLPKISARQLIEKIAESDTQQLSGTVKISTDLGLPDLGGMASGFMSGAAESGEGSSADPESKLTELATGSHTLRVAVDGPEKQKLSVMDDASEYSVIHHGDEVWAYDSASNEAYHAKAEESDHRAGGKASEEPPKGVPATPAEFAEQVLKAAGDTTSVKVDGTARVAGRDAYRLVVKPKQSGTTVGAISVLVDAKKGVPLKFTLTPASGGGAVLDVGYTKVDFSRPAASTFDFTPPKGAKVTEADGLKTGDKAHKAPSWHSGGSAEAPDVTVTGEGWNAIAEFTVPGGKGLSSASSGDVPPQARQFMDTLGDKATGKFGSGTVFKTRLVNALITDDGKVYVGAVTKDALVKAANAAH